MTLLTVLLLPVLSAVPQTPADPGVITIAAEPDYPPYSYVDETGEPTGFSVELFRAVASTMGREVSVTTDYWATIKNDLAAGRIDALPLVGRTPEREAIFDFTVPYLSLYGGIVVREADQRFTGVGDLAGRRVAVMAGDNAEEFLRRGSTDYEIVTFPTFIEALEDVSAGRSDAVVMQRLVAIRILDQEGLRDLRLLDQPIAEFRQDFCFAVTTGNKDLLATLNEGLSLVVADGTLRRLQTKWFSPMELPSRTIIIGGDRDYPPFEFVDEHGEAAGYNVDLARAIAREMGFDLEIRLGLWSHITGMLERGEIDAVAGMMYSPVRDATFDFSPAHMVQQNVIVGRGRVRGRGPRDVALSVEVLQGSTIAVQEGDIMYDFVLEHGLTEDLLVVDTQEEALGLVVSGEADYTLGSRLTAMYLIDENGWDELVVGRENLISSQYGFAVRQGNTGLLSYLAEGLAILEESGEYRRIYDRWLGFYVPTGYDFRSIIRVAVLILAPILLVLATVLAWNRSLRSQVARSTAELQGSVQRTQWLNTTATSYLARKDARTLIRETVSMLDGHFPDARAIFLALDDTRFSSSPVLVDTLGATRVTVVHDVGEDSRTRPFADRLAADGVRALAMAAVRVHDLPAGFLGFTAPAPREWNDHEVLTVEEHANLLTLILENETYQRMIEDANATLKASLEEKETLLKEVHHRVKNNLNVIVSLLRLQEDQIDSVESAREAFAQSRNRIFSMALVHQSLYHSDSLADIGLDQYIRTLVDQLQVNARADKTISYVCDLEPITIHLDLAVPCGIIVNELVTNAQKHAFPDSSTGELTVSLSRVDGESIVLTVRDNGIGIPQEAASGHATTLGVKLVTLLAAQIDGTLAFTADGGTRVDLTIPVPTAEPQ